MYYFHVKKCFHVMCKWEYVRTEIEVGHVTMIFWSKGTRPYFKHNLVMKVKMSKPNYQTTLRKCRTYQALTLAFQCSSLRNGSLLAHTSTPIIFRIVYKALSSSQRSGRHILMVFLTPTFFLWRCQ